MKVLEKKEKEVVVLIENAEDVALIKSELKREYQPGFKYIISDDDFKKINTKTKTQTQTKNTN